MVLSGGLENSYPPNRKLQAMFVARHVLGAACSTALRSLSLHGGRLHDYAGQHPDQGYCTRVSNPLPPPPPSQTHTHSPVPYP